MEEDEESKEKVGEESGESGIEDLDLNVDVHELNREYWVNVQQLTDDEDEELQAARQNVRRFNTKQGKGK